MRLNPRKGLQSVIPIVLVGLILIWAGANLMPGLLVPGELVVKDASGKSCTFVEPRFDRMECNKQETNKQNTEAIFGPEPIWNTRMVFACGDNEPTDKCRYYVQCNENANFFEFQCSDPNLCSQCITDTGKWCKREVTPKVYTTLDIELLNGANFRVGGCHLDAPFTGIWKAGTLQTRYDLYGLEVVEANGAKTAYTTNGCNVAQLSDSIEKNICKTYYSNAGAEGCQALYTDNKLAPMKWVNFLRDYIPIIPDLTNKIVTYNGKQGWCSVNSVYEIGTFTTGTSQTAESCYATYDKAKTIATYPQIECCPKMVSQNMICNDQFKWQPLVVGDCDANRPCATGYSCISNKCVKDSQCKTTFDCPYSGDWMPVGGASQLQQYTCSSGQCVRAVKNVACIPPSQGCATGDICNVLTYKCEKPNPGIVNKCGDGVCTQQYENNFTCPGDCKTTNWQQYITKLIAAAFLAGLIILVLAVLVYFTPLRVALMATPLKMLIVPKNLVIAWVVLTLLIYVMFIATALKAASMFGVI